VWANLVELAALFPKYLTDNQLTYFDLGWTRFDNSENWFPLFKDFAKICNASDYPPIEIVPAALGFLAILAKLFITKNATCGRRDGCFQLYSMQYKKNKSFILILEDVSPYP
jgi:hypothetical protein